LRNAAMPDSDPQSSILDSQLLIKIGLDFTPSTTLRFAETAWRKSHIANQLLLYDRLVLPTHDCSIVPVLIKWLGLSESVALLESKAIGFIRMTHLIGYSATFNGIVSFRIGLSETRPQWNGWWDAAMFGDSLADSIDLQLKNHCPNLSKACRAGLVAKVVAATIEVGPSALHFEKDIATETYRDLDSAPLLRNHALELAGRPNGGIDLRHLPEDSGGQCRCLHDGPIDDSIDLVLRVAELNLQLKLAALARTSDLIVDTRAPYVLTEKLRRDGVGVAKLSGFQQILKLAQLPDVGAAFGRGQISARELFELRESRECTRFRQWLTKAAPEDALELVTLFQSSITSAGIVSTLPMRVARWVLTTTWGFVAPVSGTVASLVDGFFLDRWLNRSAPKLLLDRIQRQFVDRFGRGRGTSQH
jgi:hypothetical protein